MKQVKVVLRNPLNKADQIDYTIDVNDSRQKAGEPIVVTIGGWRIRGKIEVVSGVSRARAGFILVAQALVDTKVPPFQ